MDWSILLGVAVIGYAALILVRHIRNAYRGKCGSCPYCDGCAKKGK